jgi:hypothetical protein
MAITPVIWWNNTVSAGVAGATVHSVLPDGGDVSEAFVSFIEGLSPTPKIIKIFYLAHSLESTTADCPPKTSRATLRKIHAQNFATLSDPEIAWALQPARGGVPGTSTLMFLEERPVLIKTVRALASRGIHVQGCFPITSLLELTEPFVSSAKPVVAYLSTARESAVYWCASDNTRNFTAFGADAPVERVTTEINQSLARFEDADPLILNVSIGVEPMEFPLEANGVPDNTLTVDDLFRCHEQLKPGSLANLVPLPGGVPLNLVLFMIAFALVIATAALATSYYAKWQAAEADAKAVQTQISDAQADVQKLEDNKKKTDTAQATLEEIALGPAFKSELLTVLARNRPPEITIRNLLIDERKFTIVIEIHDGNTDGPQSPLQSFLTSLGASSLWTVTLVERPKKSPSSFTINGTSTTK